MNNISRQAFRILSAVLGGVQSIDNAGISEALGLPSEESRIWEIDTHHIIAHELNIPLTADPLGGSYYVEWLTNKIEEEAIKVLSEIYQRGGMWECVKSGWLQEELDRGSLERQKEIEEKKRLIVGVNAFEGAHGPINTAIAQTAYQVPQLEKRLDAIDILKRFKETRNKDSVKHALEKVHRELRQGKNIVRSSIEAAKAGCTVGELLGTIRLSYGLPYDLFNVIEEPGFLRGLAR